RPPGLVTHAPAAMMLANPFCADGARMASKSVIGSARRERSVSRRLSRALRPAGLLMSLSLLLLGGCADYHAYKKCGSAGCPGDAEITAQIEARFKEHTVLQPPNIIYVKTVDGNVYLTGTVATDLVRTTAESVAREVPNI